MKHRNINDITRSGFNFLDRKDENAFHIAFLSLGSAIKSYFETYQSVKYSLQTLEVNELRGNNTTYNLKYYRLYTETVIHFQHFFELFIKAILRKEHILLADIASESPIILHKLLAGEQLTEDEQVKRSIEFSDALKRIRSLIRENRINDSGLDIENQIQWLAEINTLRNRIWHRGLWLLDYPALDELVGRFVLPWVKQIVTMPDYKSFSYLWEYQQLSCKIDPIDAIVDECRKNPFDLTKVAFLKELGRSAYDNPVPDANTIGFGNRFGDKIHPGEIAKQNATAAVEKNYAYDVKDCPVCGVKALLVYDTIEDGEDGSGAPITVSIFTYRVQCQCCSFEINNSIRNASEYNLPIDDYWRYV